MSKSKKSCKSHKSSASSKVVYDEGLVKLNKHAAGIDVGSSEHWVCVPWGSCELERRVLRFGAFTRDLDAICLWLRQCGVTTVAMESTGVYWIPLYHILEKAGFDVWLVNAHYVKRVPGRPKTDRNDCEWIQRLHTYGLLRKSFRPAGDICAIRALWRFRDGLIDEHSRIVQQIQKILHEMNLLLHKVVTDITGKTGMAIIRAMVNGQRDPERLARLRDHRIKATEQDIVEALRGNYRDELIVLVKLCLERMDLLERQLTQLDREIEQRMGAVQPNDSHLPVSELTDTPLKRTTHQHAPRFDAVHLIQRLYGAPVGKIPGMNSTTLSGIFTEVGLDLTAWESDKHFTSWLTVSPKAKISGGRPIAAASTARTGNRAGRYFRQAASTLKHSSTPLGEFYRRMRARNGTKHAITATARKLATIFYEMVTTGSDYDYPDRNEYDERMRAWHLRNLRRRAEKLGYELKEKVS